MKSQKKEAQHVSEYEKTVSDLVKEVKSRLVAKRDFVLHHNDVHIEIKAGDDLSSVPKMYLENLKTESVI